MPHSFNLGGGHPDVRHEQSDRVTATIGRQGFRKILDVLGSRLLRPGVVVVRGFVDGEFVDLVAKFDGGIQCQACPG